MRGTYRRWGGLLCGAVLVLVGPSAALAQSAQEIAKKAFGSTVLLVMEDANGQPLSLGSGFFVREGEIASNLHVVEGRRARKGVFITTSGFTREARDFGRQIAESVVLIDGQRLADLMIEYRVGVAHRVLRLPRVDADYFDSE